MALLATLLPALLLQISAALSEVVQRHLNVPPSRLYIKFVDVPRSDFGWNGKDGGVWSVFIGGEGVLAGQLLQCSLVWSADDACIDVQGQRSKHVLLALLHCS